jgi:hypothetical protein
MGTGTTILIIVIVIIVGAILQANYNYNRRRDAQKKMGIDENLFIKAGRYTCGHPELDKPMENTELVPKDGYINIYASGADMVPSYKANIPKEKIKNILIEDATTIQRRVTVTRMLAVGLFAFAWKKKKKEEMSYLIIEWNDGKYEHETIFEFTNTGAVQNCNTARNKLIRATS